MSADRETRHDMTQTDIALLLADAADDVEIGIAPVQAVIRGGRRRRARRWAVAAATAVVLAGSTGATLAVTGLPGGHDRGTSVAAEPSSPQARHVYRPQRTQLASGFDQGRKWRVELSVWGAPRDEKEASGQLDAMKDFGIGAGALPERSGLVGETSYYASLYRGDDRRPRVLLFDTVRKWDVMSGKGLTYGSFPMQQGDVGPERLVVGRVAGTARQVKCTWQGGSITVELPEVAAGSPGKWFVCLGPEGKANKAAEVIQ